MTTTQASVSYILKNEIVMNFLKKEAAKQIASELNGKTEGSITAKGVFQLMMNKKNEKIKDRFNQYLAASVAGAAKMREEATA